RGPRGGGGRSRLPGPDPHRDRHRLRGDGAPRRPRPRDGPAVGDGRSRRGLTSRALMRSALPILPLLLGFGGVASVLLLGRHPIPLRIVVWLFQFAILAVVVPVLARTWDGTILVHRAGGWQPPVGIAFVADRFSSVFGVTIATVSTAAVAYALLDAEAVPRQRVMALFFMIQAG